MKKFLKFLAIMLAIGSVVAAVVIYLKKNGYLNKYDSYEDEYEEYDGFENDAPKKRKYVTINPVTEYKADESSDSVGA